MGGIKSLVIGSAGQDETGSFMEGAGPARVVCWKVESWIRLVRFVWHWRGCQLHPTRSSTPSGNHPQGLVIRCALVRGFWELLPNVGNTDF